MPASGMVWDRDMRSIVIALRSADAQMQAVTLPRRRPDPQQGAALETNRPDEDAGVVRQAIVADRRPHVLTKHLEPVGLATRTTVADLAPDHRVEPDTPHLCERQL